MATQLKTFALNCSVCAAPLTVKADARNLTCGYCGSALMVERVGGTISLKTVTEAISRVQAGTDKTAAELALKRLQEELVGCQNQCALLEASYLQAMNAHSDRALMMALLLGAFCGVAGLVMSLANGNGTGFLYGIIAGICVAMIAYLTATKLQQNRIASLTTIYQKELNVCNARIRSIKQKIAKNRAIADL